MEDEPARFVAVIKGAVLELDARLPRAVEHLQALPFPVSLTTASLERRSSRGLDLRLNTDSTVESRSSVA
ncbi:MAG: hypothetical protein LBE85_11965 [Candidatus Accumulibacter sp.]|jgi:hypothetical protein|nr:hypothetical protein [Accumulibacter sp.]